MEQIIVQQCVAHIRAAAKLCEDNGKLAYWATLLGVADQLLEATDVTIPSDIGQVRPS